MSEITLDFIITFAVMSILFILLSRKYPFCDFLLAFYLIITSFAFISTLHLFILLLSAGIIILVYRIPKVLKRGV